LYSKKVTSLLKYTFKGDDRLKNTLTSIETPKYINQNQIMYVKNNMLNIKQTPNFGTITLTYQDGKLVMIETRETEK
jgi:hypothetical protein